ncbi:protein ZNF365 [Acipenser ruthenus]|uniref:protein ZNF365 n=1 Tax=Acipenser ruthenus TaxID=7906 RepID=UPI00274161F3|nr:protein ZNF365 [Acipenser ruthenus]XP_033880289.2 protein ZNF365 [Acipenser ruthenus]
MQQKLYERKETLCNESPENSSAREQLPFRCPRCGEQKRFRSLSSLRAHLEYSHTYETMHNITKYSLASACKPLDYLLEKTINTSSTENCKKRYSLQFQDLADKKFKDTERDKPQTLAYKRPPEHLKTGSCRLVPAGSQSALTISIESHVRERLDEMMKAAECTIEKRLEKVTSELAQKNTELVNTRAEFVHLSREKREVLARERALSRQVDTAVEVIAALRQQLTESERELERKEREVISIHHFLEATVQHEVCGKARLQHFIENLLQRIALAERHLEYYQSASRHRDCKKHTVNQTVANCEHKIAKARSPEGQPALTTIPEMKMHSFQKGRAFLKSSKDRLGSRQFSSSSGVYKPNDCRSEVWYQQRRIAGYEAYELANHSRMKHN